MVQTMLRPLAHADAPSVSRFEIHAERCPHLFAKIAGLLAIRSIMPHDVHMRRSANGMWMSIEAELADEAAAQFAEKLRSVVAIDAVIHVPAIPRRPAERAGTGCEAASAAREPVPSG